MIINLNGQLNIFKTMNIKPNFSELSRKYGYDRRTIKKYYEGYEGKTKARNKGSKLDRYCAGINSNNFYVSCIYY